MKLFECQKCGNPLYFENTRCERCGSTLGYIAERSVLSALEPLGDGRWRPLADPAQLFRLCSNAAHGACNWLVAEDLTSPFCRACALNRMIPNLSEPGNVLLWQRLEAAKHRLVYGLLRLDLPLLSKVEDAGKGLAFDFLSGPGAMDEWSPQVITGHANGLITIDIAEADDAQRERLRSELAEPYRTLLGHFRHEVGHHYWERLVHDGLWMGAFREHFGDERRDYGASLQAHYAAGAPPGWQERFVSGYASAHPLEDFAETWAHFLHIVDTLETAKSFGLGVHPEGHRSAALSTEIDFDPYRQSNFDDLLRAWLPLTYAVNSLNRSMGQPDLYPFVLGPTVMGKLRFVHGLVFQDRAGGAAPNSS